MAQLFVEALKTEVEIQRPPVLDKQVANIVKRWSLLDLQEFYHF